MTYRKKLIEVALPLDAISEASAKEKSIRHGHPSALHLWWSRKPLAASRAVLFASLVDDPSEHPEQFPTEQEQNIERTRLFKLMQELVKWENSNNEKLLHQAKAEIVKSADGQLPPFLDPFAGGGSIPLEAQRLGLETHASDLNPVAVLLNKALIEIPPKFADLPPINPDAQKTLLKNELHGVHGLADDIRYYGKWMRYEAEQRIGHLYPKVKLPKEYGEEEATVIAWLWVRTVTCPNPACGTQMPLTNEWWLSLKKGKEVWIEPKVNDARTINYVVHHGSFSDGQSKEIGRGTSFSNQQGKKTKAAFCCVVCRVGVAKGDYIDIEANAGRLYSTPIALVAERKQGRIYLPVDIEQVRTLIEVAELYLTNPIIQEMIPKEPARGTFASNAQGRMYGFKSFSNYFTVRQLTALTTFCSLIKEVKEKVKADINNSPMSPEHHLEYANAISTYLSLALDKCVDYWSSLCSWITSRDTMRNTFARQGITMMWNFAEANPFSESTGNFLGAVNWISGVVDILPSNIGGYAIQRDAMTLTENISFPIISTDPPYYDNVSYADLSDFFYVWLRQSLNSVYPELFNTMLVPKSQELVATPYRFKGNKKDAQVFFEHGLEAAFVCMRKMQHPNYPLTVYYAFKQSETDIAEDNNIKGFKEDKASFISASTGWETMLEGLIRSGFTITGTWPIRTERSARSIAIGVNSLASSIVLVCRPRPIDAPTASRRQFINELRAELADALKKMQQGTIAPVDLAQASIGPGMAVYSRYSKVIESDGSPLAIRTALQLINRELDTVLAEQEGEYDVETRWAVAWFEEYSMHEGQYGRAEVLSKAKNASLQTMVDAGILEARAGKVRLIRREELSEHWQPDQQRLTTWEVMQRMIHALDKDGWQGGGIILAKAPHYGEAVRDLAYRLYNICERKGWSQEALYYNMLVTSWTDIDDQARSVVGQPQQATFSFDAP